MISARLACAICVWYGAIAAPAAQAFLPAPIMQVQPDGSNPDATVRAGQVTPGEVTGYTTRGRKASRAEFVP